MKKFLACLLAMMMAVLPIASMADSLMDWVMGVPADGRTLHMENRIIPGTLPVEDAEAAAQVADLLSSLSTKVDLQEGGLGFVFQISGEDALTLNVVRSESDIYLKTNLLGDTPIVVGNDEFGHLAAMIVNWAENKQLIDAETAENARKSLQSFSTQFTGVSLDLSDVDLMPLMMWAMNLTSASTAIDPATAPEGADPADAAAEIRLTKDMLTELVDIFTSTVTSSESLKEQLGKFMNGDAEESINAAAAQMKEGLAALKDDIVIRVFTAGEEPVAITANIAFTAKDEDGTEHDAAGDLCITRTKADDGETMNVVFAVTTDDKTEEIKAVIFSSPALSTADITLPDDASVNVTFAKNRTETAINDQLVINAVQQENSFSFVLTADAVKDGTDVAGTVTEAYYAGGQEEPLLTVVSEITTLDKQELVPTDSALRVAALSDTAFDEWMTSAFIGMYKSLQGLMQMLPISIPGMQ